MNPLKVRRYWQTRRRYTGGILICFCVLGLVSTGYGQTDNVDQLISKLQNRKADVRGGAAYELGTIKDPRAVEPLIAALKDRNPYVRRYAAEALGNIKGPRAVEPLIATLKNVDDNVVSVATIALFKIGVPGEDALLDAMNDVDSHYRETMIKALIALGEPNSEIVLIRMLNKYGDKDIALDFIVSGNNSLNLAGHYEVKTITTYGSGSSLSVRWGGNQ